MPNTFCGIGGKNREPGSLRILPISLKVRRSTEVSRVCGTGLLN